MTIAVGIVLGLSVALVIACSIGVAVMPDPYQKLHFLSPPATLSAFGIALCLFASQSRVPAAGKGLLTALVLLLMNAVVTHATARAHWIRTRGEWAPQPGDRIPLAGDGALEDRTGPGTPPLLPPHPAEPRP